ncbi:programmed cell death protein 2-like isoform X2 [Mastacembelus armatus]|uniref:programmed cell death protein 2-like isoform X2 n=1 Tax=Mastacembelus armatus TaxID=205130 RepID=UPI000E462EEB|nr:programmed cell death protein 2-like isoform X2 [Mastacembelus armatus]
MASPPQDFTLIGLCDGDLDPNRHRSSYQTNKVGGHPDWLPGISRQCPRCGCCGAPLAHVVQVYCPLDASPSHRNLHLFACLRAECSGRAESWRALRSQALDARVTAATTATMPAPAQEAPLPLTAWCDAADDWGMEEGGDGSGGAEEAAASSEAEDGPALSEQDVSSGLQGLCLEESQEGVPVFRSFFIGVVEESDLRGEDDDLTRARELLRQYERREGVAAGQLCSSEGGDSGEKYEKTRARHGDAVFSRFMKKISWCPQQILRYCRGGKPLFISELSSNLDQMLSTCGSCGGSRTFELQLMPALVSMLQREDCSAELEFGTVLVYTCTNSCWTLGSGSTVEELCFVQMDPDQQLFK